MNRRFALKLLYVFVLFMFFSAPTLYAQDISSQLDAQECRELIRSANIQAEAGTLVLNYQHHGNSIVPAVAYFRDDKLVLLDTYASGGIVNPTGDQIAWISWDEARQSIKVYSLVTEETAVLSSDDYISSLLWTPDGIIVDNDSGIGIIPHGRSEITQLVEGGNHPLLTNTGLIFTRYSWQEDGNGVPYILPTYFILQAGEEIKLGGIDMGTPIGFINGTLVTNYGDSFYIGDLSADKLAHPNAIDVNEGEVLFAQDNDDGTSDIRSWTGGNRVTSVYLLPEQAYIIGLKRLDLYTTVYSLYHDGGIYLIDDFGGQSQNLCDLING